MCGLVFRRCAFTIGSFWNRRVNAAALSRRVVFKHYQAEAFSVHWSAAPLGFPFRRRTPGLGRLLSFVASSKLRRLFFSHSFNHSCFSAFLHCDVGTGAWVPRLLCHPPRAAYGATSKGDQWGLRGAAHAADQVTYDYRASAGIRRPARPCCYPNDAVRAGARGGFS